MSSLRLTTRLYLLQRLTAAIMAPLILVHIALIFYATHDGLTAAEILDRTRGSTLWFGFYQLFVISAAIHGAIGLRSVAKDWVTPRPAALHTVMWLSGLALLLLGTRAVIAVIAPGAH
ncbi:MAG: succinate dehydrogenase [Pseudomonadota bacterium]